jgi:hypothetical protein
VLSSTTRPSRRLLRTFGAILVTLAATTASLTLVNPATAADGDAPADPGTIGVATRPAGTDGRPDDRTRFSYSADPGQTVTDQVLVGNTGNARQDFTVYATDAYNSSDGTFSLLATADTPTALGSWVKFDNGEDRIQFSLDPDEVRLLTFTVAFPADATPGDHAGGLVASVIENGQQVNLDRRVATAMYARVSGELQPRLTVSSFDAAYQGDWWNPFNGTVKMLYTVTNSGNVALAANVTGSVNTWFGVPAAGQQGAGLPTLLPGNSATYELAVQGVGQWLYLNPAVTLRPFVDATDPALQVLVPPVSRDGVVWAVPWMLLILLVIAAAIYLFVRWRRRRDEVRAQEWIEYTEQQAAAAAAEKATVGAGAGKADDS